MRKVGNCVTSMDWNEYKIKLKSSQADCADEEKMIYCKFVSVYI